MVITDKKVALGIVKTDGKYLRSLSESLRDNFEIVKIAVGNNMHALKYASDRLRDNAEIVITSFSAPKHIDYYFYPDPLRYVSSRLQHDKYICIALIKDINLINDRWYLGLQNDLDVILTFININYNYYRGYINPTICNKLQPILPIFKIYWDEYHTEEAYSKLIMLKVINTILLTKPPLIEIIEDVFGFRNPVIEMNYCDVEFIFS